MRILAGVAVAALLVAAQVQATIAYNFSSTLAGNQVDGPFSLGTVFNVTTPVNINELGAFDNGANGIGGVGIDVAIYQITLSGNNISSGSLVVNPVSFSGTAESLLAGTSTRVSSIPQVALGAGTYMVVANHYGPTGSERDYNPYFPTTSGPNLASANPAFGVTFAGGYFNTSGSLSWGSTLPAGNGWVYDTANYSGSPSDPRYAAGNFDFTPVPEVAHFAMAGVGLLGLVYIGRYARLRRKLTPA